MVNIFLRNIFFSDKTFDNIPREQSPREIFVELQQELERSTSLYPDIMNVNRCQIFLFIIKRRNNQKFILRELDTANTKENITFSNIGAFFIR